jgi:hypothetical protein
MDLVMPLEEFRGVGGFGRKEGGGGETAED